MIAIYPGSEPAPGTAADDVVAARGRGVVAYTNGGCEGCAVAAACPYFPEVAERGDEDICHPEHSARERVQRLSASAVEFWDPPGVEHRGRGLPNPSHGVVIFHVKDGGRQAAEVTCTLAEADRDLCEAIVDDYLARMAPDRGHPPVRR
jgi:hypothetical protein